MSCSFNGTAFAFAGTPCPRITTKRSPLCAVEPCRSSRRQQFCRAKCSAVDASRRDSGAPSFRIQPAAGRTGTLASNLWPLPILGSYGWILTCWRARKEEDAAKVNAHVSPGSDCIGLSFSKCDLSRTSSSSTVTGIVTGDYNVADSLQNARSDYCLTFFDGPKDNVLSLETVLTTGEDMPAPAEQLESNLFGSLTSFAYQSDSAGEVADGLDVRTVYRDTHGGSPQSKFQFFALNCSPIPFPQYTAMVSVYKQYKNDEFSVSLESGRQGLQYSFVKWNPMNEASLTDTSPLAKVAVAKFRGVCSDAKMTKVHRELLGSIERAGLKPVSTIVFRVFMPNTPGISMFSRKNELVVELDPK